MSAVTRPTPTGYTHVGSINADQIRLKTKPLSNIAVSGSASDITGGTLPVTSVPSLDASMITTGTLPTSRLPSSVQSSAGTTDVWTGFNQHAVVGTGANPLGTGGFLSWGRDGTGKTAFCNQGAGGQPGGWEFVTYSSASAFANVAATLSATGRLQVPAIDNGGAGLTVADSLALGGHAITGVTSLANGGAGLSIPENVALGGKTLSGVAALSNGGGGISVPETLALGGHAIGGVTTLSNGGGGISVPENVAFGGKALSGVAALGNGGAGISVPETLALGGHAISGLGIISNGGNGIRVNDSLILGSQALAGVSSLAISGSAAAPLTIFDPTIAAGGTVGVQLGADATGASLVYTQPSSSTPQSVRLGAQAGSPGGLTVWANGAVSSMGNGALLMRAFDESGSTTPHFSGLPIEVRLVQAVSFGVNSAYVLGAPPYTARNTNTSMRITGYIAVTTAGAASFQLVLQGQARVWVANTLVFDRWSPATGSSTTLAASITLPANPVPLMIEFAGGSAGGQLGLRVQPAGAAGYADLGAAGTLSYDMYEAAPSQFGTSQFNNGLIAPSLGNNGAGLTVSETTSFGGNALTKVAGISNGGSGLSIPENVNFGGYAATRLSAVSNNGQGITTPDPWVFGGLLTSSSVVSFGQPPSTASCLLSLYSSTTLTRASTAFFGLGLGANMLAYRVPATAQDHVFYAGSSEIARARGTGGLVVGGQSAFPGGLVTAVLSNGGNGISSGEVWTLSGGILVPRIGNGGNGVTTSDPWTFTGNVAFGSAHTPAYALDCNAPGYFASLVTPSLGNGGNGLSVTENTSFAGYDVSCAQLATTDLVSVGGALTVGGSTALAAATCSSMANSGNGSVAGTLRVMGATTLAAATCASLTDAGALTVAGTSTLAAATCTSIASTGTLSATGTTTLSGSLGVTGATSLAGLMASSVASTGTLSATGATTLSGSLAVTGATTLAALTAASFRPSTTNTVIAGGPGGGQSGDYLSINGGGGTTGLVVNYSSQVGVGTANPGFGLDVSGTMRASGAVTLGSTLAVGGATTLAGLTVGTVTGTSSLSVAGATSLSGTLAVAGVATLASSLVQTGGNHVMSGGPAAGAGPRLQLTGGGSGGATVGVDLATYSGTTPTWSLTATDNGSGSAALDLAQVPATGSSQVNRLHVNAGNGFVGFGGQTNPAYTVDISGGIRATGTAIFSSMSNGGSLTVGGTLTVSGATNLQAATCTALAASGDCTLNTATVGALGFGTWAGLANAALPQTGYGLLQSSTGQTIVNNVAGQGILFRDSNATGATYSNAALRIGDTSTPTCTLDVAGGARLGGRVGLDRLDDPINRGLVLQYTFKAGTGATAYDQSPSGTHGALSGNFAWCGSNPFDGLRGSYLTVGDASAAVVPASSVGSATITASCWYSPSALNSSGAHNVLFCNGPNRNLLEVQAADGQVGLYSSGFVGSGYVLTLGKWYHLAAVSYTTTSGGTTTVTTNLYVNARSVMTTTGGFNVGTYPVTCVGNSGAGQSASAGQGAQGRLGDVRVWTRALSAPELEMVYSQGVKPVFRDLNSGYVGVNLGSGAPTCTVDVGDTTLGSNAPFLRLANSAGGAGNTVGLALAPWSGRTGGASAQVHAVDDGNLSAHLVFSTAAAGSATVLAERMRVTDAGSLGVGTPIPAFPVDVAGAARASVLLAGTSTDTMAGRLVSALGGGTTAGSTLSSTLGQSATTGNQAEWGFVYAGSGSTSNAMSFGFYGSAPAGRLWYTNAGQLGVGTNMPAFTCDVAGTLRTTGAATLASISDLGALTVAGSTTLAAASCSSLTDSGTLTVGGTASLQATTCTSLTASGATSLQAATCTTLAASGTLSAAGASTLATVTVSLLRAANTNTTISGGPGGSGGDFLQINGGGGMVGLAVNYASQVGIGTAIPAYTCDVAGTLRATGGGIIGGALTVAGATTLGATVTQTAGNYLLKGGAAGGAGPRVSLTGAGGSGATVGIDLATYGTTTNGWSVTATDNGNNSASLDFLQAQTQTSQTNVMHFSAGTGFLGLGGQTNPASTLDVTGGVRVTGSATFGGGLAVTGSVTASGQVQGGSVSSQGALSVSGASTLQAVGCTTLAASGNTTVGGTLVATGNAGFGGTSGPAFPVDATGAVRGTSLLAGNSTDTYRLVSALNSSLATGGVVYSTLGQSASTANQAEFAFLYNGSGSASNALTMGFYNGTPKLYFTAGGLFGVGASPAYTCDVAGTIRSTGAATLASISDLGTLTVAGSTTLAAASCSSLTASGALTVGGTASLQTTTCTTLTASGTLSVAGSTTLATVTTSLIRAVNTNTTISGGPGGSGGDYLQINGGGGTVGLAVNYASQVGMGTAFPAYTCDVAGSARVSGKLAIDRLDDAITKNCVLQYTFKAGTGATVYDQSPSGNNATLTGTYAWSASNPYDGNQGAYIAFTDQSGMMQPASTVGYANMTVSAWYSPSGSSTGNSVVFCNGTNRNLIDVQTSTGTVGLYNSGFVDSGVVLTTGGWYHLAAVVYTSGSTTTYNLYVNGRNVLSTTSAFNPATYPLTAIGNYAASNTGANANTATNGQAAQGKLEDARVWARALSSSEVARVYGAKSGGVYRDINTGFNGVNTTSPAFNLDVTGTLRATGAATAGSLTTAGTITQTGGVNHTLTGGVAQGLGPRVQTFGNGGTGATSGYDLSGYGGPAWSLTATDNGAYSANMDFLCVPSQNAAATSRMHFNGANNNIGVGGQTNPAKTLDVTGDINYTGGLYSSGVLVNFPIIQAFYVAWTAGAIGYNSSASQTVTFPTAFGSVPVVTVSVTGTPRLSVQVGSVAGSGLSKTSVSITLLNPTTTSTTPNGLHVVAMTITGGPAVG